MKPARETRESANSFCFDKPSQSRICANTNRPIFSGLSALEAKQQGCTRSLETSSQRLCRSPVRTDPVSFRIIPDRYIPPRVDALLLLC
jgi:hypothetical protein